MGSGSSVPVARRPASEPRTVVSSLSSVLPFNLRNRRASLCFAS
jgi:hypothetical protein